MLQILLTPECLFCKKQYLNLRNAAKGDGLQMWKEDRTKVWVRGSVSFHFTSYQQIFHTGKTGWNTGCKANWSLYKFAFFEEFGRLKYNKQKPPLKVYNESKQGQPGYRFISGQLVPIRKALWTGIAAQESQTNQPSAVCLPQTSFCIHRASPSDDPGHPAAIPQTQFWQRDLCDHGCYCKASWSLVLIGLCTLI